MSYLTKAERRKFILELAMHIAMEEGLNTLTVRHIAQQAGLSVGLIHHHFNNVQELKAEVFMALVHKCLDPNRMDSQQSFMAQLLFCLGFTDLEEQKFYIRLWNDAEYNSHQSEAFKIIFLQSIEAWQHTVVVLLEQEYPHLKAEQQTDLAWQLIALTMGLEQLIRLNPTQFNLAYIERLLTQHMQPYCRCI